MENILYSKMFKGAFCTYHVNVKRARNGAKYLVLSETKPSADGSKRFTRKSMIIFNSEAQILLDVLNEALPLLLE